MTTTTTATARRRDVMADKLQSLYTALHQQYMQRHTALTAYVPQYSQRRSQDGKTVWEVLVDYAAEKRISPLSLLTVMFLSWQGREPPRPHHAMTPALLAELENYSAGVRHEVRTQFASDRANYEHALAVLRTENAAEAKPRTLSELNVEILANDTSQLSPLFRYSVARTLRLSQLAADLRAAADMQFLACPDAYLENPWLPLLSKRHAVVFAAQYATEK